MIFDPNDPLGFDPNDPLGFVQMSEVDKMVLCEWIFDNLDKRVSINKKHSSYGLKHRFEHDKNNGGFYVSNGEFKGAMLHCGFNVDDINSLNWCFNIHHQSKGLKKSTVLNNELENCVSKAFKKFWVRSGEKWIK